MYPGIASIKNIYLSQNKKYNFIYTGLIEARLFNFLAPSGAQGVAIYPSQKTTRRKHVLKASIYTLT